MVHCTIRFLITEKAPTRAFSWLEAATTAFNHQEKALVGAISVIVKTDGSSIALVTTKWGDTRTYSDTVMSGN